MFDLGVVEIFVLPRSVFPSTSCLGVVRGEEGLRTWGCEVVGGIYVDGGWYRSLQRNVGGLAAVYMHGLFGDLWDLGPCLLVNLTSWLRLWASFLCYDIVVVCIRDSVTKKLVVTFLPYRVLFPSSCFFDPQVGECGLEKRPCRVSDEKWNLVLCTILTSSNSTELSPYRDLGINQNVLALRARSRQT